MNAPTTLDGHEVLLAVTGGIACYKTAALASQLAQAGAGVTVAMTDAARRFIAPLTFQSLTARPVYTSLWDAVERYDPQHIALVDRAEVMVIAPATANLIGKMASGIADDLVSTLAMTAMASTRILLAPAMNTRMWNSPVVLSNVTRLTELGIDMIGPNEGRLACGTVGAGRMAEPDEIFGAIVARLTE
ncbi:MAG: flavoprotein [Planctomycetota bacterium]